MKSYTEKVEFVRGSGYVFYTIIKSDDDIPKYREIVMINGEEKRIVEIQCSYTKSKRNELVGLVY